MKTARKSISLRALDAFDIDVSELIKEITNYFVVVVVVLYCVVYSTIKRKAQK